MDLFFKSGKYIGGNWEKIKCFHCKKDYYFHAVLNHLSEYDRYCTYYVKDGDQRIVCDKCRRKISVPKPSVCEKCSEKFESRNSLFVHLREKHIELS